MATKKAGGKATKKAAKKTTTKRAAAGELKFKTGDRVTWDSSGGAAEGRVVKVATASGKIKNFEYKASKDDPRYIVETDEGGRAAHKADELKKA